MSDVDDILRKYSSKIEHEMRDYNRTPGSGLAGGNSPGGGNGGFNSREYMMF